MSKLKGVWIDGLLWESKEFKPIEMHLLQKIKDLDNDNGCTAMNAWFADFLGVSKSRVSQLISKFKSKKLISVKLKYNGKEVIGRVIRILKGGMLYFKEGMLKTNNPLSNPKDPSLIFSGDSNRVLSNRVNSLIELNNSKEERIKQLEQELFELKNQDAKEREKDSAKKEKRVFPDITARKSYKVEEDEQERDPRDMRTNPQNTFSSDQVEAIATLLAIYPKDNYQLLIDCQQENKGLTPTNDQIKLCRESYITAGLLQYSYLKCISDINLFQKQFIQWIPKHLKFLEKGEKFKAKKSYQKSDPDTRNGMDVNYSIEKSSEMARKYG